MKKIIIIAISVLIVIITITLVSYYSEDKTYVANYVEDLGYKFDKNKVFYKKVITNNTLNEFYEDVDDNKDSSYLEYYFQVDTYSFIEMFMSYSDDIMESYNITTDLKNNKTTYTYELTKESSDIIIEGEYDEKTAAFSCGVVSIKQMNDTYLEDYCSNATTYGEEYLKEKNKLLNNEKFQEILNK